MKSLFTWFTIFVMMLLLYSNKGDLRGIYEKFISSIFVGRAAQKDGALVVYKSADDHFYLDVLIDGKNVNFLVDTGATKISLSKSDATKVGINIGSLAFDGKSYTASGISSIAYTRVGKIQIGDYVSYNQEVVVMGGNTDKSLLGVTFLQKFDYYKFEGDRLFLVYDKK